jgi:hypothetical protein
MVVAGSDHVIMYEIGLWYCYSDGHSYNWVVDWNTSTGQISIYSGSQSVILDTYSINTPGWIWTPIKIVGNIELGKWDRLLVGNRGYNLSSYIPLSSSLASKGMILIYLICKAVQASTSGDFGRYGYMILTIDEP